ncbi:uncharacterized protein Fot_06111 [Forsythia ovata]|uniref:Uncharacterized protein n=1 Tax=Forsythia ovata TaxID=205694 RepID=A0ABD1WS16_9LAMI
MDEENEVKLLQRYRRDRWVLLDFILAGSLIKKVIMPRGAVTLDDVDLDQVSVDYVLNCAKKGLIDDDLRETAYEILLAAAGASGGLIVPSKEKKKEKKSRLTRKLERSKSEHVTQSHNSPGLVGLLETMRVQMEVNYTYPLKHFVIVLGSCFFYLH